MRPSEPVSRVLGALRALGHESKSTGGGWTARCPAHDDRKPSLAISAGDDGRALLCCHAGCTVESVAKALNLSLRDLMPVRAPGQRPTPTSPPHGSNGHGRVNSNSARPSAFARLNDAVQELERRHGPRSAMWLYHDLSGQPVGAVLRWDRPDRCKDIRPLSQSSRGWITAAMPKPRPLYALPELGGAKEVLVTEGEKAADAARSLGLAATTSAHGSRSAAQTDWSPLAGKDVIVLPDADEPGERYADEVADLLARLDPQPRVRIVEAGRGGMELTDGEDVHDFIAARRQAGQNDDAIRSELMAVIEKASKDALAERLPSKPVLVRLADVEPAEIRWLWPQRIALGKITVVAGDPGLGKSFLGLDMAARLSMGSGWPDLPERHCERGGVVLLSAEDDLADTIRPRLDAAGADVTRITALQAVRHFDAESGADVRCAFSLVTDLPALEHAIKSTPACRLVIVDPISAYLGSADSHKNAEVRAVLAPLAELAGRYGVAVVAITHLRKGEGQAMYRAMGSLAFVAAARAVWAVSKDHDDSTGRRRLFLPVKNNLGNDQTGLAYSLSTSLTPNGQPVVLWEANPVTLTADEALSVPIRRNGGGDGGETRRSAVQEAADWLREALADGPLSAKAVKKAASDVCVSWPSIRRAKASAGVTIYRDGFGPGGQWMWRLADSEAPAAAPEEGAAKQAQDAPGGTHSPGVGAYEQPEHLCVGAGAPEASICA